MNRGLTPGDRQFSLLFEGIRRVDDVSASGAIRINVMIHNNLSRISNSMARLLQNQLYGVAELIPE